MQHILVLISTVLMMTSAHAAGVYDGMYNGTIQPTPGMSKPACGTYSVTDIAVKDGRFRYAVPALSGFVNVRGFVTGKIKIESGERRQLVVQGLTTEVSSGDLHITAGIIDDQSGCDWTMDLKRQ